MRIAVLVAVAAAALGFSALVLVRARRPTPRPQADRLRGSERILFPFLAGALSPRGLDVALRMARAEGAVLVPVFLARVSLDLPLETPLPRQCGVAIPMQEAIEQRATAFGVPVDARIERGRTNRHALREAIEHQRFDRIVISAAGNGRPGFGTEDVAWLLDHAPGEIAVLRPSPGESPAGISAGDRVELSQRVLGQL